MQLEFPEIDEKKIGKDLYDYQHESIDEIFKRIHKYPNDYNVLYQLPTGGGKTVIFSEIAKRYIQVTGKKVMILTHRIELCGQTSYTLTESGVTNKVIDSKVKELPDQADYNCFVAMVETLNNRLQDDKIPLENIGLIIVDEAHYNSFRKLFKYFKHCVILGVTATPLSSNINLPMHHNYNELIVGESIGSLVDKGFLSKAQTYTFDVRLGSLKIGANGDYTVSSSERLYSSYPMLERLLQAYEEKAVGTKTLIFNNGINTSKSVYYAFKKANIDVRHLDNTNSPQERREILNWFKHTPDAVLTSVGILTTGFDEPTVETIILNRATKSLTLYHQMIGRGSRKLSNKSSFNVIDLGNNAARFGLWDNHIDWHEIFRNPDFYLSNIIDDQEIEKNFTYDMPEDLKFQFKKTRQIDFDIKEEYDRLKAQGKRPKAVVQLSIEQHSKMCIENSNDFMEAKDLAKQLDDDIAYRIKLYSQCISKTTDSYLNWLKEEYKRKLHALLIAHFIS